MAAPVLHGIAAAVLLLSSATKAIAGSSVTCPSSSQFSCANTTVVQNLCCFNAPGGQILQTQFWDTSPATGPVDSWTVHGLWPDHCDGTYDANCDSKRAYTNITQILQSFGKTDLLSYMQTYWPDYEGDNESFWEHEWGKHGTCISTLKPSCYTNYVPTQEVPDFFQKTVDLFKTLPSYQWLAAAGIVPSSTATYTSAQIEAALSAHHGNYAVTLGCSGSALDEIWYHYHVSGSVQTGTFAPAAPDGTKSTCPATGIKYLPKGSGASTVKATSTKAPSTTAGSTKAGSTTVATSTPTGAALSGSGYLNVVVESTGAQTGCLIGAGTWYTSGTCATYTATAATASSFTLKSSKGYCGVVGSAFVCAASNTAADATLFTASGNQLRNSNGADWSADQAPTGSQQAKVYSNGDESVKILIEWQAL